MPESLLAPRKYRRRRATDVYVHFVNTDEAHAVDGWFAGR